MDRTNIEALIEERDNEVTKLRGEAMQCYDRIDALRTRLSYEYDEYTRVLKRIIEVKNEYEKIIRNTKREVKI